MANRMDIRSAVVAALVAIVWGLCFVIIQVSLPDPAPLLLAGARALIGGGILAVAADPATRRQRPLAD